MSRTSVLAVIFEALDHDAGLTGRASDLLQALEEAGAITTLYVLNGALPSVAKWCDAVCAEKRSLFGFARLWLRAAWRILSGSDKVVVLNAFKLPASAVLAALAKLTRKSVLCDMQDLLPEIVDAMNLPVALRPAYRALLFHSEQLMVRSADLIVSPGREANRIVAQRCGVPLERFRTWHNAHSFGDRRPRPPVEVTTDEPLRVVYMGGIQPVARGLEIQLGAIALANSRGVNTRFVTFTAPNGWLNELISRLSLGAHVEIHPYGAREQALAIAARGHVAVMRFPLGTPSKFFEHVSVGNVILAQRDCIEIAELLPDCALFDGTASGLADLLVSVSANYSAYRDAQAAVIERVSSVVAEKRNEAIAGIRDLFRVVETR